MDEPHAPSFDDAIAYLERRATDCEAMDAARRRRHGDKDQAAWRHRTRAQAFRQAAEGLRKMKDVR